MQEKQFTKSSTIHNKTEKITKEEEHPQLYKDLVQKPTADIILNGKKYKTFLRRSGIK